MQGRTRQGGRDNVSCASSGSMVAPPVAMVDACNNRCSIFRLKWFLNDGDSSTKKVGNRPCLSMIFAVCLDHEIFNLLSVLVLARSVFWRGIKVPNRGTLENTWCTFTAERFGFKQCSARTRKAGAR